jgi:UDP-glucose 4-epimerase
MKIAWVVGSRGLLGSALCRQLGHLHTRLFFPEIHFSWDTGPLLVSQMSDAVHAFQSQVGPADQWEIYWAAGVGAMNSPECQLLPETETLSRLLRLLEASSRLMAIPGAVALASSAGAIYAGATDDVITENSLPAPTTAYAREKMRQEDLIRAFAASHEHIAALIARITTLYGPGQATGKRQGLLAHIARSIVRNRPIQIYVPYDTIRDYIVSDDAAAAMIATLRSVDAKEHILTKIIASEQPVTIAEIISIFRRISRRPPKVVTSASGFSGLYSRRVQFRSIVSSDCRLPAPKSLPIGIFQLLTAERSSFVSRPN